MQIAVRRLEKKVNDETSTMKTAVMTKIKRAMHLRSMHIIIVHNKTRSLASRRAAPRRVVRSELPQHFLVIEPTGTGTGAQLHNQLELFFLLECGRTLRENLYSSGEPSLMIELPPARSSSRRIRLFVRTESSMSTYWNHHSRQHREFSMSRRGSFPV